MISFLFSLQTLILKRDTESERENLFQVNSVPSPSFIYQLLLLLLLLFQYPLSLSLSLSLSSLERMNQYDFEQKEFRGEREKAHLDLSLFFLLGVNKRSKGGKKVVKIENEWMSDRDKRNFRRVNICFNLKSSSQMRERGKLFALLPHILTASFSPLSSVHSQMGWKGSKMWNGVQNDDHDRGKEGTFWREEEEEERIKEKEGWERERKGHPWTATLSLSQPSITVNNRTTNNGSVDRRWKCTKSSTFTGCMSLIQLTEKMRGERKWDPQIVARKRETDFWTLSFHTFTPFRTSSTFESDSLQSVCVCV